MSGNVLWTGRRPSERGFTLIELLVVIAIIAIIAILVSLLLPAVQQSPVNPIGIFQKLGRRNDGFVIGEF